MEIKERKLIKGLRKNWLNILAMVFAIGCVLFFGEKYYETSVLAFQQNMRPILTLFGLSMFIICGYNTFYIRQNLLLTQDVLRMLDFMSKKQFSLECIVKEMSPQVQKLIRGEKE